MVSEVFIGDSRKRFRPNPTKSIGKGGEADIYDVGNGVALKVFKSPDHPDLDGLPHEQEAARRRIAEHQQKLRLFPKKLPLRVVAPLELAYGQGGNIVGYTMPLKMGAEVLLRYGEVDFRQNGVKDQTVVEVLRDLHSTVSGVHESRVVIGDFNDLNVLVSGEEAFIIDADSCQFGSFPCRVFTERFVDPLLCDPKENRLILNKPHNEMSDWYAFAVMLMQTLLCLSGGPYGGVYKPKDISKRIGHSSRPLHRITVFHPEVRYPKPSRHFSVLPDSLLQCFHEVFERDKRFQIPAKLLGDLRWVICKTCGVAHARAQCPHCRAIIPQTVTSVSTGTVSGERIFRTEGQIVFATSQAGVLRWLYHHNGEYRRENGSLAFAGTLDSHARFRISQSATVIASGNRARIFTEKGVQNLTVDTFGMLPVIDANERHIFWHQNGQIKRTTTLGVDFHELVGDVLPQQTLFWTGEHIGFGFYRAGGLSQCFVFNPERRGINNSLTLRPFKGQLVDSTCLFGKDRIWFFVSSRIGGKTMNSCFLIRHDGIVEAQTETEADDGSWLGTLRGKCAIGDFLLVATDDGIVRVKASGGTIAVEKEFPDSARFVHTGRHLFLDKVGLMVVGSREIWRLVIK